MLLPRPRPIRLAIRAIILRDDRLLLVNAWPGETSDLWCAPGGGTEPHQSLPENLVREVREETGLEVAVGPLALVNEFHEPATGFHQVELFFRATITGGSLGENDDPEGIVTRRRFFSRAEMEGIRFKPSSLPRVAWDAPGAPAAYDPLELLMR